MQEITNRGGAQGTRARLLTTIQAAVRKAINVRAGRAGRKAVTAAAMISPQARGLTAHMALNAAALRMERDAQRKARTMNGRGLPLGLSRYDDGDIRNRAWRRCRAARKQHPRRSKLARRMQTSFGIRNTATA